MSIDRGMSRQRARQAPGRLAGLGTARNLDGVDEAVRTRELATALPELAIAFLVRSGNRP